MTPAIPQPLTDLEIQVLWHLYQASLFNRGLHAYELHEQIGGEVSPVISAANELSHKGLLAARWLVCHLTANGKAALLHLVGQGKCRALLESVSRETAYDEQHCGVSRRVRPSMGRGVTGAPASHSRPNAERVSVVSDAWQSHGERNVPIKFAGERIADLGPLVESGCHASPAIQVSCGATRVAPDCGASKEAQSASPEMVLNAERVSVIEEPLAPAGIHLCNSPRKPILQRPADECAVCGVPTSSECPGCNAPVCLRDLHPLDKTDPKSKRVCGVCLDRDFCERNGITMNDRAEAR